MASECKLVEKFQGPSLSGELKIIKALRLIDRELNNHDLTVAHLAAELGGTPNLKARSRLIPLEFRRSPATSRRFVRS